MSKPPVLWARLMIRSFRPTSGRLIREDPSHPVIHAAMAAAGKGKYPGVCYETLSRALGDNATKAAGA